jgi:hypothetical protein
MSDDDLPSSPAEWDFSTYDLVATCSEYGEPIRLGEAAAM